MAGAPGADAETDVLVVGAGPAGLALTLMLLRSGIRVTVLEKSTDPSITDPSSAARDLHGEILQPGGQLILDRLGVLAAARARGACDLAGFRVADRRRVLLDIDYGRLPRPYDRLIALPQRHLLAELADACGRLPGFTLLAGHRIGALRQNRGGRYTGAVAHGPGGRRVAVRARVVVAADGRFSRTRRLAGIDAGRIEAFDQDVVWCTLPAPGRATGRVTIHRAEGTAVLVHDTHPDRLRIGWTRPHGTRRAAAADGLGAVRAQLAAAVPQYADLLHDRLTDPARLSLLDVFAAQAGEWVRDGLVLLGDAAHTHGPLGAQGLNLALQDAAVLHPVLVDALNAGDFGRDRLAPFEAARRPVADAVTRMQRVQAKAFFGGGGFLADFARARVAGLVGRTPLGVRITGRVAYGGPGVPVDVRTDLFSPTPPLPVTGGSAPRPPLSR